MRWMEIAWEQEGLDTAEVAGPGANRNIIRYFHQIQRPDITSDEIYWCMAFYCWCLQEAGIDLTPIAPKDRLLAISALKLGTLISEPRVGCGLVMPRYSNGRLVGNHVGFVVSWTATTIDVLGGNQKNCVCRATFKRTAKMKFVWPETPKTPNEVAEAGSRTVAAANRQIADGAKSSVVSVTNGVLPAPPTAPPSLPAPEALMGKASAFQNMASSFESLTMFTYSKWPWILAAFALYWFARMGWDALQIRWYRTQDANTGKAPVIAAPDLIDGVDYQVVNDEEASLA